MVPSYILAVIFPKLGWQDRRCNISLMHTNHSFPALKAFFNLPIHPRAASTFFRKINQSNGASINSFSDLPLYIISVFTVIGIFYREIVKLKVGLLVFSLSA